MPTFFANPYGLLGLLALPAILLIHMLREKSRTVRVSTLFLLAPLAPRTPRGRALHFIQNSVPLWLQMLAALLGTWLLADPRWVRANSFQSVAVILDNSASMAVARERVLAELPPRLRALAKQAGRTQWTLGTSDAPGITLYRGGEVEGLIAALAPWQPLLPRHDPAPAFATALAQARGQGTILYITDEQPESLPAGITLAAYGRPIDNCGFAGVRTWREGENAYWEAIVKNSGATPQLREWWLEAGTTRTRPQRLSLAPGQLETVSGAFPSDARQLRVLLSGDAFTADDQLPLVAPEPKPLSVGLGALPAELAPLLERVLGTVPSLTRTKVSEADVALLTATASAALPPSRSAIGFGPAGDGAKVTGDIIADADPLMEGLVWESLLTRGPGALVPAEKDKTLLWQGERPLIFLHTAPSGARQLIFNFDVATANTDRLPAFVLLVGRFLNSVREAKNVAVAENFETNEVLPLKPDPTLEVVVAAQRTPVAIGLPTAPLAPGFFSAVARGTPILAGAAHFGDPREADFQKALSRDPGTAGGEAIRQLNSLPDPLAGVWLLLLAAVLLGSWYAHARSLALEH